MKNSTRLQLCFFYILFSLTINAQSLRKLAAILHPSEFEELAFIISNRNDHSILSNRDAYQVDSIYFYEEFVNNLTRRSVYQDYNANCDWAISNVDLFNNGSWEPSGQTSKVYDNVLNLTTLIAQDFINNNFVNSTKSVYEYDDLNRRLKRTNSSYDNNIQTWLLGFKSDWTYIEDTEKLAVIYDSLWSNNQWEPFGKTTYSYIGDLLESSTRINFDMDLQLEENAVKRDYFYNAITNERDSSYTYFWNSAINDWELGRRIIYSFEFDQLSTYQYDRYELTNNTWTPWIRWEVTFNDINRYEFFDFYLYNEDGAEYALDYREEYFYSSNPLDAEIIRNSDIKVVMANPFSDNNLITIFGNDIETLVQLDLIDVNGKVVFNTVFFGDTTLSLPSTVPVGSYFLNLSVGDGVVFSEGVLKVR